MYSCYEIYDNDILNDTYGYCISATSDWLVYVLI